MVRRRRTTPRARTRAHAARPKQPRVTVPATRRVSAGETYGRADGPPTVPQVGLGAPHVTELAADGQLGLLDVALELVGADHATLRLALAIFQREQDRLLNRAWRRPGGLARPAGL
jgi:hypothetical protein